MTRVIVGNAGLGDGRIGKQSLTHTGIELRPWDEGVLGGRRPFQCNLIASEGRACTIEPDHVERCATAVHDDATAQIRVV